MKITTVKCDECGVVKEDSNHWLHVDVHKNMPVIVIGRSAPELELERHDICGQGCFHRHLDKLLFPDKPVALFTEPVYAPPMYWADPDSPSSESGSIVDDDSPF